MEGVNMNLSLGHMSAVDCIHGMFLLLYAQTPYPSFAVREWNTEVLNIPKAIINNVSVISCGTSPFGAQVVLARTTQKKGLMRLYANRGYVSLDVCTDTEDDTDAIVAWLQEHLPVINRITSDNSVYVKFWAMGTNEPQSFSRKVLASHWGAVHQNYTAKTRQQLDTLMQIAPPEKSGQLILWHGEPGTGKTWSIRALGQAWKKWCKLEYITDPEVMFGERAAYLTYVLLDNDSGPPTAPNGNSQPSQLEWRLLILEDTGELLRVDAKERTGQAMSRLLNTVDGLLGQGLRILVLITTNEDVGRLHPAIIRPGRCLKEIEFVRFSEQEASEWIWSHNAPGVMVPSKPTIAELYGALNGWKPPRDKTGAGFTG